MARGRDESFEEVGSRAEVCSPERGRLGPATTRSVPASGPEASAPSRSRRRPRMHLVPRSRDGPVHGKTLTNEPVLGERGELSGPRLVRDRRTGCFVEFSACFAAHRRLRPSRELSVHLRQVAAEICFDERDGRITTVGGGSTAAIRRHMPDDGLSSGKTVPFCLWRLSSSAARRAASWESGMYTAASIPWPLDPSSLWRSLCAWSLSNHAL